MSAVFLKRGLEGILQADSKELVVTRIGDALEESRRLYGMLGSRKPDREAKRALTFILNHLDGMGVGVESGDLKLDDLVPYVDKCVASKIPTIQTALDSQPQTLADSILIKSGIGVSDGIAKSMDDVNELRSMLPKSLDKLFVMLKVPVIPIFGDSFPNVERVRGIGIDVASIDSYLVMLNQLVLFVSHSAYNKRRDTKTSKSDLCQDIHDNVVPFINSRNGYDLALVNDYPDVNPENTDIIGFWLMPLPTITRLREQRFGDITSWGFPF